MNRKIFILLISIIISASYLHAFSFGKLVDNVKKASEENVEVSGNEELIAQQKANLEKYKSAKEKFLKGYSSVQNALGNENVSKEAEQKATEIASKTEINIEEAAKITDDILNKTQSSSTADVISNISSEVKSKYAEGMELFKQALQDEIDVANGVLETAKKAKELMASGTAVQRIQLASSFSPTLELAKIIPEDLDKSKKVISEYIQIAKKSGLSISDSLKTILQK